MEPGSETQALIQKAVTIVPAPMTLGFVDCVALVLGFLLMMVSAFVPAGARSEQ